MSTLPLEKPVVLVRGYKNPNGRYVRFPQCKVFEVDGTWLAYRDIYPNKSQMFRDNSWNIDHIVFEWMKNHGVDDLYHFVFKESVLYRITTKKIDNAIERGDAKVEKLNSHTQIFAPRYLWEANPNNEKQIIGKSKSWISTEIDVANTAAEPVTKEPTPPQTINPSVMSFLRQQAIAKGLYATS